MCAAMRATASPRRGYVPIVWYEPPLHSGSAMIACRPTSLKAMFCAEWRGAVAIGRALKTDRGYRVAHSSTCIPPIDPPTTQNKRSMPRWSINSFCARTMSPMVTTGKDSP